MKAKMLNNIYGDEKFELMILLCFKLIIIKRFYEEKM